MTFREEMKRSWDGRGCDEGMQAAGPGGEGAAAGHGAGEAEKGGWRGGGGAGKGEGGGPGAGRGGYGRKTIAELCSEEGLALDDALVAAGREGGVTADGEGGDGARELRVVGFWRALRGGREGGRGRWKRGVGG